MLAAAAAGTALLSLGGCSGGHDAPSGAVTADEDRQLNEAAASLDANIVDADGPPTNEGAP